MQRFEEMLSQTGLVLELHIAVHNDCVQRLVNFIENCQEVRKFSPKEFAGNVGLDVLKDRRDLSGRSSIWEIKGRLRSIVMPPMLAE